MPTSRSSRVPPRRPLLGPVLLALAVALGSGPLTACSLDEAEPPAAGAAAGHVPDVAGRIQRLLDRRSAAIRAGDERALRRGLAGGRAFVESQVTYLDNLRALPVATLRHVLDPASLVRSGRGARAGYRAVVEVHLELAGYDARPVLTRHRYRFRSVGGRGRLRVAAVRDRAWEEAHGLHPAPWETGPVLVRSAPGVLGVFDARSEPAAARLLASVSRGIGQVAAVVPYAWSRRVVLYALSEEAVLAGVPRPPGGDPRDVDALAFPVPAGPDDPDLAATRLVLHPRMLGRDGPQRDRLLRHELTHVALGDRAEAAPVWLTEGIAELVSVQPLPARERRLPAGALAAARAGITDLPADATFNGARAEVNYAVAWWACEHLARRLDPGGPAVLFGLLDAVQPGAAGEAGGDPDRLLVERVGVDRRGLAREAGRLILATYG